ncbi:MAG: hypothetical protein ACJAXX_002746 [Roseivirga sp.]|jgi:hypothetical protein
MTEYTQLEHFFEVRISEKTLWTILCKGLFVLMKNSGYLT